MNWKKWIVTTSMLTISVALSMAANGAALQTPKAPAAPPAPKAAPAPPAPKSHSYVYTAGSAASGSYLGVDITDINSDRVSALKLKDEHGVEITMVDRDAPAGKAGLKEHDVILDFNGTRVEGEEQLRRLLRETPPGREITLGISRDGQPMQIKATLGDRKKAAMVWSGAMPQSFPRVMTMPEPPEMPDMPGMQAFTVVRSYSESAGMMVDNLTPQLGEYFGVKSGAGVLVRSVEKGSAAEAAGLKAGDVIVKVDNEKISDRGDWRDAMRKSGTVSLGIVRDKREQNLKLTLPERKRRKDSRLRIEGGGFDDDFDFDADIDFSVLEQLPMLQEQIRLAAPEAQRAMQQARLQVSREMRDLQPRVRVELENARKQLEREMKNLQKQLDQINEEQP
jgi:serine protease Do